MSYDHILTAIGAFIVGSGPTIYRFVQGRRRDTIDEWAKIAERLQRSVDALEAERVKLTEEVMKLRVENAVFQTEIASLKNEITTLKGQLEGLRRV